MPQRNARVRVGWAKTAGRGLLAGSHLCPLAHDLWVEISVFSDEPAARIAPFDAVALDVGSWWG